MIADTSFKILPLNRNVRGTTLTNPYSASRKSSKLAEPEQGTLRWLLLGDEDETVESNRDDQPGSPLSHENFVSWRDSTGPNEVEWSHERFWLGIRRYQRSCIVAYGLVLQAFFGGETLTDG
jgi:hypothetical protein